jgi:hypothetical protein
MNNAYTDFVALMKNFETTLASTSNSQMGR